MQKIKILSIDGGGIRGIIPGTILTYVEKALQRKTNNPNSRLADHFDLIASTSTGGILTCCYLIPNDQGQSKYTTDYALDIYLKQGPNIFKRDTWQRISSLWGVKRPKYSATAIESALKTYFGETKIFDLRRPCIITSYDSANRRTLFFNQADHRTHPDRNYLVRDVARATSAAPTYFSPTTFEIDHTLYEKGPFKKPSLIDGGVFVNNPALSAYAEARTLDFSTLTSPGNIPFPSAKDMMVLSIGTGTVKQPYLYQKTEKWGALRWVQPVIDVMMSGNSETVDYQLRQIFKVSNSEEYYHRIQFELNEDHSSMDDVKPEN
jgi:patatin-like phospholipase/acyl hydrolase